MNIQRKNIYFFADEHAVLGLPMRLTVSLVIGTIVLIAILSILVNPCVFPQRMTVSLTPMTMVVPGNESENVTFAVFVNETEGRPVSGASILIKGLGAAGSGFTDERGKAIIVMQIRLEDGFYEGYLDVLIKAPCHESFEHEDMIKVVKSDE